MIRRPTLRHLPQGHEHMTLGRELKCVRQQILENLLQSLRVADERGRQIGIDVDAEREILRLGDVVERAFYAVPQRRERVCSASTVTFIIAANSCCETASSAFVG